LNKFSLQQLRGYASLVRLRPFDQSTPEGRSHERHRKIVLSALASFLSKGINSITLLVSVPLLLRYLGPESFGVWTTITAAVGMLAFSDLGMGNGMISVLATTEGTSDRARARVIVSSATLILALVGIVGLCAMLVIYPFVDWPWVFNAKDHAAVQVGPAFLVCMLIFFVVLPLNVVQAVHLGFQEGFVVNSVLGLVSAASLVALLLSVWLKFDLVGITAMWFGAAALVRLGNTVVTFFWQRPWLRPHLRDFQWREATALLRASFLFMVIGMSIAVGYTSDSLVVAQILGQETVAQYSVPYRLFSIVTVVLAFFLLPLWPAYAEAAARGDVPWIRRTLRRSLQLGLAFNISAGLLLVLLGRWIIRIWVGPDVVPSTSLLVAFGLYLVVNCLHGPLSMLMNGLSVLGFQLLCWISMAVVNLGLSIVLTRRFGVSGVVFGTVVANFVCFVVPGWWYAMRHLHRLEAKQRADNRGQAAPAASAAAEPAMVAVDPSAIPPAG